MNSQNTHTMAIERTFAASIERLWQAWSNADDVMQWWGPTGFTSPICKMDFRVGGKTLVCMRTPDGYDMFNTWTYTKIVPMECIEFIQHFSDADGNPIDPAAMGMPAGIPVEVPHHLTFAAVGNNQSEFTVTEFGYTAPDVVEMSRAGMNQVLDKLDALIAG